MAINIKFDLNGNPESPTIILANRNGDKLGQLKVEQDSIDITDKLNDVSEFSFIIHKYEDGVLSNLWDKVVNFKLVYCKEWDMWFEITVELDEETETIKTVFCTQLGQAELSQIKLYNIEINTEDDIAREDYKSTILYDMDDPKASLLNRILDKAPHYSIRHVDSTIARIQRTFSFDKVSICDALKEIAEEIGCLVVYDSYASENGGINRSISLYDLWQNCNSCGHRGEFIDECPECKSKDIKYGYGEDTLIFVTADELASDGIQLTTDTDAVKNCFKLIAGDDLITATVRNCNPNGSDYIYRFSDDMKEDMSDELVAKLKEYDELYERYFSENSVDIDENLLSKYNALIDKYSIYDKELRHIENPIIGYPNLMNAYYDTIDLELYLRHSLMPSVEMSETNATRQALLLSASNLSPVSVENKEIVSLATLNSIVLSIAKIFTKPTYKVEVKSSELLLNGNDKQWKGNFLVTNYSDKEDTAESQTIIVDVNDDYEQFIKQKIDKALKKEEVENLSITGLFEMSYDRFCSELKKYALNNLIRFRDACQMCIDILIEQGVADNETWGDDTSGADSNLYEKLYKPYRDKLTAIESEIKVRENELNVISGVYDTDGKLTSNGIQTLIEDIVNEIQTKLDFEKFLGEKLWFEFCSYRREDEYSNDNYISDGLNNAELFKKALEFFEVAKNEIYKASEYKHSISTNLNNLLAIPKFKDFVNSFKLGNWLRVQLDDKIYKLRLIEYGIDFGDFENIQVEFSDVSKVKNGISDVEDILSQASSMATSYGSVKRQASQGDRVDKTIHDWIISGLDSALVRIKNNTNEDITFSKNGLLCRSYDQITESYSPEQLKLTHNILAYTNDDWLTVKQAIGKHDYVFFDKTKGVFVNKVGYGMTAEFVTSGVVSGSQIIGGDIYSDNYSIDNRTGSYLNLRDGTFSLGGGSLRFENGKLIISSPNIPTVEQITEINEEYLKTTTVYAQNLQVGSANIRGQLTADQINTTGLIAENISGTTITGKNIYGGSISIGENFSVDELGNVYANDGNFNNGIFNNGDFYNINAVSGMVGDFIIATEMNNNEHAYKNTLYRIVHATDGYDYQIGLKGNSDTNNPSEAAFYIRKKSHSGNWSTSTTPFYVRNNGLVYAKDLTVGDSFYMDFNYGEVSSDNGYIDYSKRVKVAETDFESVYFGEINNGMYMQFSQDLSIYNTRKEILRISPNESGGYELYPTDTDIDLGQNGTDGASLEGQTYRSRFLHIYAKHIGTSDWGIDNGYFTNLYTKDISGNWVKVGANSTDSGETKPPTGGNNYFTRVLSSNKYYLETDNTIITNNMKGYNTFASDGTTRVTVAYVNNSNKVIFGDNGYDALIRGKIIQLGDSNPVISPIVNIPNEVLNNVTNTTRTLGVDSSGNVGIISGGGTTSYTNLSDKPSINDVTLSGNITLDSLGIGTQLSLYGTTLYLEKSNGNTVAQVSLSSLSDGGSSSIPDTINTVDGHIRPPVGSGTNNNNEVDYVSSPNNNAIRLRGKAGGTSYVAYTVTGSSSDVRLKNNISDSQTNGLNLINSIKVRQFNWIQSNEHQKIGFIADELEMLDKKLTVGGGYEDDGTMLIKTVNSFYLQGYEVKAIQELSEMNNIQSGKIQELTTTLLQLQGEISILKQKLEEISC